MFPSTLSSVALLIVKALDAEGIDGDELIKKIGLDPARLGNANARYSFPALTRLWKEAASVTGSECFGLTVSRYTHPTTIGALGYSFLASSNLKEALERVAKYISLVNSAARASLTEHETEYSFQYFLADEWKNMEPAHEAMDLAAGTLLNLCRWCAGDAFNPSKVELCRPEPNNTEPFNQFFRAPIIYSRDKIRLYFPRESLHKTLLTGNAELARMNDKFIVDSLASLNKSDFGLQIKSLIFDMLPDGEFTKEKLLPYLPVSMQTLHRKLEKEGTNFKQLLEDTRKELVTGYMADTRISITEISHLLGFSTPGNFTRAFKRWTGQSPKDYRNNMNK